MIIDIHAHISNHEMQGLHVKDASIDVLDSEADKHCVNLVYIMATYFPFKGTGLKNKDLLKRIGKNTERFRMFCTLVPDYNDLAFSDLEKEERIQGIKLYPGYQDFLPADHSMYSLYTTAGMIGLPVAVHSGELHHCCNSDIHKCGRDKCPLDELDYLARPIQFADVFRKFPKTKFIMSHLSNPYFDELRWLMNRFENVYTDISGQFVSGTDEASDKNKDAVVCEIKKFMSLPNGAHRILFGTDWPIQSYEDTFDLVNRLDVDKDTQEYIYWKNAYTVLGGRYL